MNRIAAVVAGLSLAFVGTSATIADTINVPGDYPTIQGAINASSDGDVINIAPGTYYESDLNPDGKVITIQGTLNGDGTLATTIDAQQNARVVTINSGEGSGTVIRDLVITGGSTTGFGGGITIRNGSSPIISNCTISDNSADRSGGGIMCHNSSNPTITGCTISGNSANGDVTDARGGGIYCFNSEPTITDCTISDNQANYAGGGIHCWDSNPIISSCTISDNTTDYDGGGIYCYYSNPTISGCTISGNEANVSGGGIKSSGGNPVITGCTISSNTASFSGGGIYCNIDSNPTIIGSVICENVPDQTFGSYSSSESCIRQSCEPCYEDSDDDGVPDNQDQCPGYDDNTDADGDGTADGCDNCPDDPLKTEPGNCGCGFPADTPIFGDLDCDGDYDIDDIYAGMANFGITTGTPGDVNADGSIDTSDLDELRTSLDLCASDTDMDGDTDIEDLLNVVAGWGTTCP